MADEDVTTPAPNEQIEQLETRLTEFVTEVEERLSELETRVTELE